MADVITRFKLETTQYDSKLRDEAKRLADFTRQCAIAGSEFGRFSQKNVEAARALGNIAPSANNAKDKVKELVGAFNDWAKAYNALTKEQQQSDFGKAMSESLSKLKVQIAEAKQELYGMGDAMKKAGGGGLFSGLGDKMSGSLQVFAGNMLTKAAGAVASLGSEMYGMVQQGIELAKQGEGIRIAFERLGRGDILDGLRQATHGTVTDLELMKAAVKFNDFKLPVEELGTMLAFAQQKAKDTGQSVDYMVDSIVTGLGRKSLMILDNLGLSATEVKERMAETGDMTKAVGAIIREQMAKAGDYVETAADRAAQANVSLQNKMEELGRKFAPVEEASSQLWTSMKIGILDIIGGPLATLLNQLTEAGRLKNMLNNMNGEPGSGNTKVDQQIKKLNVIKKAGGSNYIFNSTLSGMMEDYNRQIMALDAKIKDTKKLSPDQQASKFVRDEVQKMSEQMKALGMMRDQLAAGAKQILQPIKQEITPAITTSGGATGGGGRSGGGKGFDISSIAFDPNKAMLAAVKSTDEGPSEVWKAITEGAKESTSSVEDLTAAFEKLNKVQGVTAKDADKDSGNLADNWRNAGTAISAVGSAMSQIEDPAAKVMSTVAQAIATIALTYAKSLEGTFTPWDWIAGAAAGAAAMVSVISAIHSATGYAEGGIIKGNSYSGDNIYGGPDAMVNAGELVLNKAQQNSLAQQLDGNGMGNINLRGVLRGTDIILSVDRTLQSSGRGQLLTWG